MRKPSDLPSELTLLGERWGLRQVAGTGATSTVYRLVGGEGRQLAIKIGSDAERLRLAEEAELYTLVLADEIPQVRDAGILPRDTGELSGKPYIALEWLEGQPLDGGRVRGDRLDTVLRVARDIGRALEALHAAGVSHGDVKPANVIGRDTGRFALVDLGLGTRANEESPSGGTPRYLAPECFVANAIGDARARDVFALGALLAELALPELTREKDLRGALASAALPDDVGSLVRPLVAPSPGARPTADWVVRCAMRLLGDSEEPEAPLRRREQAVRSAYLFVRRAELVRAARGDTVRVEVTGTPGRWLGESTAVLNRVRELRSTVTDATTTLHDLDAFGRSRFVTRLVGSVAAGWPVPTGGSDSDLVDRLLERVKGVDPRGLSFFDLGDSATARATGPDSSDPIALALSIGSAHAPSFIVDRAEALVVTQDVPGLALALGQTLGRAGGLQGAGVQREAGGAPGGAVPR